jgi:hypothetical protein
MRIGFFIGIGLIVGIILSYILLKEGSDIFTILTCVALITLCGLVGNLIGLVYINLTDTSTTEIIEDGNNLNLLTNDFSIEFTQRGNKIITVNGENYPINSVVYATGNIAYIERSKTTFEKTEKSYYTNKLVIGNKQNNEKINDLLKSFIGSDNVSAQITEESTANIEKEYCNQCGNLLEEKFEYCPYCGHEIEK